MALLGHLTIALALSSLVCGLMLWATGGLPAPGAYEVHWQGQLGTAMGYGAVATAMAALVWPVLCLLRALRWLRGWRLALILANALVLLATLRAA